jgi:hypothetical protein
MECNMKPLPDKAEIVEQIVTALGRPLRQHRSKEEACDAVERAIKALRAGYGHPRPDVGSIRKAAKNLHEALEPLNDAMPIFIKGCDRKNILVRELRSALDYLECTKGPSPRFDAAKYCAATFAYRLVNEFSQKSPSTTFGGQVREIGALLYLAFSGEEADLKRQTDDVCRNRRYISDDRLRTFVIEEGKVHEAYLDECQAIPGAGPEMIVRHRGPLVS